MIIKKEGKISVHVYGCRPGEKLEAIALLAKCLPRKGIYIKAHGNVMAMARGNWCLDNSRTADDVPPTFQYEKIVNDIMRRRIKAALSAFHARRVTKVVATGCLTGRIEILELGYGGGVIAFVYSDGVTSSECWDEDCLSGHGGLAAYAFGGIADCGFSGIADDVTVAWASTDVGGNF